MHDPNLNEAPLNPIAPVVLILFAAIAIPELIFQGAERGLFGGPQAVGWRQEAARVYGFYDPVFTWMVDNFRAPFEHVLRFFSYSFVHLGFGHAVFVGVFTLALGKFISESLGSLAVLILFFASAFLGALGYGILLDEPSLLLGGYPAVYGLIGGFTWVMYVGLTSSGKSGASAFNLIGIFMAIQLIWKLFFGGTNEWLAELIGFLTGFSLSIALSACKAGSVAGLLERIRRR